MAEGEEAAIASIDVDTGLAIGKDVCYQAEEISWQTHGCHSTQEEGGVDTIICFSLIQANDVARGSGLVAQMRDFRAKAGVFCDVSKGYKALLV